MKLENVPENIHSIPPRKSYNPFDSDDDALDSPGLTSKNMYVKEKLNGFDLKAFGKSSDSLVFHMDNSEFLWDEEVLDEPATADHHALNVNSNVNTGLFEKEGQPFTDKIVTECELEFVICSKGSSTVKDIGMDENSSAFLDLGSKIHDDMKIKERNSQMCIPEAPNTVDFDELNEEAITGQYLVHEFGDSDLLKITELTLDIEDRALPGKQPKTMTKGGLVSDGQDQKETERSTFKHYEPDKNELSHDKDAMEKKGHEASLEANNLVVIQDSAICFKGCSTVKDIDMDENSSAFLDLSSKNHDDMKIKESNSQIGVLESPKSVDLDGLNEETITGQYLVHEFGDDYLLKITELTFDIEDRSFPGNEPPKMAGTMTEGGLVSVLQDQKETERSPFKRYEPDKNELSHDNDAMAKKGHEASCEANNVVVIQDSPAVQSPSELPTEYGVKAMTKEEETLLSDDTHDSDNLAYSSKVESTSVTFDFGSTPKSKLDKLEDEPEKAEVAKPPSARTMTRQEEENQEVISGSSILLARLEDQVHGETSFSAGMPVPLPSLITYSEPLTYSGSLSLRSDSSAGTGSTRSFAFPVLQTEWSSSPARMGKKGQRHMKKHRGWAFSCCKF